MPRISGPSPAPPPATTTTTTSAAPASDPVPGTPSVDTPPPSAGDGFDAGGTAPPALVRGGLPEVLLEVGSARVVHGTDPGDFYCEHMFFRGQQHAMKAGSSVVRNAHGEPLVGFLHVPWDAHTSRPPPDPAAPPYTQAERHGELAKVVGAALAGYAAEAGKQVLAPAPLKLLVTGYGPFSSARNNPTGDFVSHLDNLDRAMAHGFGAGLLTPTAEVLADAAPPDGGTELRYRVKARDGGQEREVLVRLAHFRVADEAIDGTSETSVQKIMDAFAPEAVLSMGVAGGRDFRAEFHADDGGLADSDAAARHEPRLPARVNLRDNYALARAIHTGTQRPAVPLATLLTGGDAPV